MNIIICAGEINRHLEEEYAKRFGKRVVRI